MKKVFLFLGYTVAENFQATSQKPGQCHSVASPVKSSCSLDELLAYENEAVEYRIARDLNITFQEAKDLFTDLKKFLWSTSQTEESILPPPKIDEAWHAFILFTNDYNAFCEKYFGQFIHHVPHGPNDPILGPEDTKPTITLFSKLFGEPTSKNWDFVNFAKH